MAKNSKGATKAARACDECYKTVFPVIEPQAEPEQPSPSQRTLSGLPSWFTIISPAPVASTVEALMAIRRQNTALGVMDEEQEPEVREDVNEGRRCVKGKAVARPRSYYEILEDFQNQDYGAKAEAMSEVGTVVGGSTIDLTSDEARETEEREGTARKLKRFSMPAVAVQSTNVVARTKTDTEGAQRARRFSLMPAGRSAEGDNRKEKDLARGVAAGRLNELLGRGTKGGAQE